MEINDIPKEFVNFLSRLGQGFGKTEKPKDLQEAKLKTEFYDNYCKLLEEQKKEAQVLIDSYIELMKPLSKSIAPDDKNTVAVYAHEISKLRLANYEIDKELLAKRYYKEFYAGLVFRVREHTIHLTREASEKMPELVASMNALIEQKGDLLNTKEKAIIYGLIDTYERGFKTDEERNTHYTNMGVEMQRIMIRLAAPNVSTPVRPNVKTVDLSKK